MQKSPVFEQTYRRYIAQVAELDLPERAEVLGARSEGDALMIPLLGLEHRVSAEGIVDPDGNQPIHSVSVLLARYAIMCPEVEPEGDDWVTYKDFKDAAPFVGGFVSNTENAISKTFGGKLDELAEASEKVGGVDPKMGVSYELVRRFAVLPRLPMTLLYNDADEEFPADCTLLFERRAEKFLDPECLAIAGWILADGLKNAIGVESPTIM